MAVATCISPARFQLLLLGDHRVVPRRRASRGSVCAVVKLKGRFEAAALWHIRGERLDREINTFRQSQRIVEVNAKASHGAVHLCVSQKELDGPKIACLPVDLGNLGPLHGVGAKGARFKTCGGDPIAHDAGVLPGRKVGACVQSAGPQVIRADQFQVRDPSLQRQTGRLGDLEQNGFAGHALRVLLCVSCFA